MLKKQSKEIRKKEHPIWRRHFGHFPSYPTYIPFGASRSPLPIAYTTDYKLYKQ